MKRSRHRNGTPSLKVGGGLGIPAGDFGDGANMGFAILGGVSVPILDNVHAMAEGHYSKYGADEDIPGVDADAKLAGGNIGVMVRSSSTPLIVYGHGGLGLTRADVTASASVLGETISVSSSENAFSFVIGGGIQYAINPSVSVAIDARYNHALTEESATQWMPITVSISVYPVERFNPPIYASASRCHGCGCVNTNRHQVVIWITSRRWQW